jgi:acyl carrier protein
VNVEELREQIKVLIVKELQLDDVSPGDILVDAPIFGHDPGGIGLGLDSIDALELSIAINRTFGVAIQPDDASHHQVFASVNALADYIQKQKAQTA